MTEQERMLIDALFDRLGALDTAPHDPEAEGFITARLRGNPGLAYTLAQTVLMQNQELAAAEARLVNLQAEVEKAGGTSSLPFLRDDLRAAGRLEARSPQGFLASAPIVTLAVAGT
jgi:hypothetical protein